MLKGIDDRLNDEVLGTLRAMVHGDCVIMVDINFPADYVLLATVAAGLEWLAVIIVLNAALAAFYYLRVVVYMYMREPQGEPAPVAHGALLRLGLAIAAFVTVALGLLPGPFLEGVGTAAKALGTALP